MNWKDLLMQALDEAHDSHDDGDMCDCYDRLRAMVTKGLYWFPLSHHDIMEPPIEGPETLVQNVHRVMLERIEEDFWRAQKVLMEKFSGLSSHVLPRVP